MSGPFEARYPGICDECDEPIAPGQTVQYVRTTSRTMRLEHYPRCPAPEVDRWGPVCPSCWMIRSLDGSCACEVDL